MSRALRRRLKISVKRKIKFKKIRAYKCNTSSHINGSVVASVSTCTPIQGGPLLEWTLLSLACFFGFFFFPLLAEYSTVTWQ